jgi:hypothetical protein
MACTKYDKEHEKFKHGTYFYKRLFGKEPRDNLSLDEEFWEEHEKVFLEENHMLEAELTEEEIKRAIDSSYKEGAPALDEFSLMFYQRFWSAIKDGFMAIVRVFLKVVMLISHG